MNDRAVTFRIRTLFLALLLAGLFPLLAPAQDTLSTFLNDHMYFGPAKFESAKNSADFVQFRKGLEPLGLTRDKETVDIKYRLVWSENQHGGRWFVTRGDGRVKRTIETEAFPLSNSLPLGYRTADGRRVLILVHEEPCGLICRSVWYYVEE